MTNPTKDPIPGNDPAEIFRQEAQELLEILEQALLDLERAPKDHGLIDTAFRALHTIKGSGAMFGFEAVAAFTHGFETAFDRVRKGLAQPSRDLVAVALAAKDHIRSLIEDPAGAGPGEAILDALRLISAEAGTPTPGSAPLAPTPSQTGDEEEENGRVTWRVRFKLAKDALVNGTNPLLLLDELRSLGPATVVALSDGVPPLEMIEPTDCHLAWDVTLTTDRPRSDIEDVFMFVADDMDLKLERVAKAEKLGRILVRRGDAEADAVEAAAASQKRLGAILVDSGAVSQDRLRSALAEQRHTQREAEAGQENAREPAKASTSLRVQAERLDELMDRVGELVIAQARLTQLAAAGTDANIKMVAEEMERLSSGLRDITMGIRMVPIGTLFGRFRRLVHDLSRELGKDVELACVGEETELDKTVVERLADPLVHLIRNSVDHGLEAGEERTSAGKTGRGTVRLSARHAGAEVLISISDDGRGLDAERIRARAEEQGLLAPGAKASDGELFQFLFQAGFSTARVVSAVSGRGVGMDVVKRTIEGLRGAIDIATKPGQGTEVTLRLPLTLAIIDGLLIRVGQGRYAIPLSAVEECVELSRDDDTRSRGRSFLNIRGELVPFLRLRELFNAPTPPDPYQKVVIVASGEFRVGLVVDQIIGNHQTVIKSLSKLHADVETFSGATILGDGTVALILDVAHLVEFGQAREERMKAS